MNARFWRHVHKTRSCWIWQGNLNDVGYGRVKVQGRLWAAHRVAYELEVGPVPPGAWVRHTCGEPACVRPSHLSIFPVARLSPQDIEAIRESKLPNRILGEMYGVSRVRISQVKRCQSSR